MNEDESNLSQTSEIEPNEKLGICTFCGNKNEIEHDTVTCVTEVPVLVPEELRQEMSTSEDHRLIFDSIEWNMFLCHSCIVGKRKEAFFRALISAVGLSLFGLFMAVVGVPFLQTHAGVGYQFELIWKIFIIVARVGSIGIAIVFPFVFVYQLVTYTRFVANTGTIEEEDKRSAFIEAGRCILEDLQRLKNASKFKHFPLPKSPTYEDVSRLLPGYNIPLKLEPEMKILGAPQFTY